jgi:hypothetical protein
MSSQWDEQLAGPRIGGDRRFEPWNFADRPLAD